MWTFRTCRKGSSSFRRRGACRRLSTSALSADGWRRLRGRLTTSALRRLWRQLTISALSDLCAHGWRRLWRRLTISALSDLSAHGWRRSCGRRWRLTTNGYVSSYNSLRVVFWRRLNAFDGAVRQLATLDGTGCIFLFFLWILISCILRCIQHLSRSSLSDVISQQSEWPGARVGDCSIYISDDVTLGSKSSGSDWVLLYGFDWPILVDSQFRSFILLCSELFSFLCFVIRSVRSFYKRRTWIKGWTKNKT